MPSPAPRQAKQCDTDMIGFKDIVARDASKVFLNTSEFADYHVINGRRVCAVIDEAATEGEITVKFHGQQARQQTRLANADVTVYVNAAECPKPAIGTLVVLDGLRYIASAVTELGGIYKIELSRAEGR